MTQKLLLLLGCALFSAQLAAATTTGLLVVSTYLWCGRPACYLNGITHACVDLNAKFVPYYNGAGTRTECFEYYPFNQTMMPGIYLTGPSGSNSYKAEVVLQFGDQTTTVEWTARNMVNVLGPVSFQSDKGEHCELTANLWTGPIHDGPLDACVLPLAE